MSRKKVRPFYEFIDTGIFPAFICIANGYTIEKLAEGLKEYRYDLWHDALVSHESDDSDSDAIVIERTYKGKRYYFMILKHSFDFSDYHYTVLAHEVLHLCQFILRRLLNRDDEIETEAYLHTYIMSKYLENCRDRLT